MPILVNVNIKCDVMNCASEKEYLKRNYYPGSRIDLPAAYSLPYQWKMAGDILVCPKHNLKLEDA